jgi:hypothetical protein
MTDISADAQATIDASISAANLAEQQGNHSARAAAATAALNAWSAAMRPVPTATPSNAVEASQRLDYLNKSAEFRTKYFAGDSATVKEFNDLNEKIAAADPIEFAIAGQAPPDSIDFNFGAVPSGRDLAAGAKHLSEIGFTSGEIREVLTGNLVDDAGPLTPVEIAAGAEGGQRWLDRATKDTTFRKSLLEGDRTAREIFDRICAVIAAGKSTP